MSNGNGIEPHDRTKNANGSMNMLGLVRMLVLVLLVTIVALIVLFVLFGIINLSTIRSVDESTKNTDDQLQEMIAREVEDEKERQILVTKFFNLIGNLTENQKTNIAHIGELQKALDADTKLTSVLQTMVTNNTKKLSALADYIQVDNNRTETLQGIADRNSKNLALLLDGIGNLTELVKQNHTLQR